MATNDDPIPTADNPEMVRLWEELSSRYEVALRECRDDAEEWYTWRFTPPPLPWWRRWWWRLKTWFRHGDE